MDLEAMPLETRDEQESPVDVAVGYLRDLREFQRTSNKQILRESWKAACEEALLRAFQDPDMRPIAEHFEQRKSARTRKRGLVAVLLPPGSSRPSRSVFSRKRKEQS
jgi:hypothetical protein